MHVLEYSSDNRNNFAHLHDRAKKPSAVGILESARLALMYLEDSKGVTAILQDTEQAIHLLYPDTSEPDRYLLDEVLLSLCAATRKSFRDEMN